MVDLGVELLWRGGGGMKTFILVFLLLLVAESATARQVVIYGPGTASCGSWTQERRENRSPIWNSMLSWSLGYISARSRENSAALRDLDADAVTSWLDQYCAAHPLVEVMEADDALFDAMKEP